MNKGYAKQIIEWAVAAKQTLTIPKEIIIDGYTTNEQLGTIIRMMYIAKVEKQNETILKIKQNLEK